MPTADASHLFRLMSQAMEQYRLPSMVQKLFLSVGLAGPLQSYQPSMFADDSISQVTTRRSLARMIESIAGRLGRESVMGVRATRDPLPEAAYKLQPLAGESRSTLSLGSNENHRKRSGRRRGGESAAESTNASLKSPRQSNLAQAVGPAASDPLRRPLRLFKTPLAIKVLDCFDSGVPSRGKPSSGFIRSGSPGALNGSRPVGGKGRKSAAIITEWNWTAARGGGSTAS